MKAIPIELQICTAMITHTEVLGWIQFGVTLPWPMWDSAVDSHPTQSRLPSPLIWISPRCCRIQLIGPSTANTRRWTGAMIAGAITTGRNMITLNRVAAYTLEWRIAAKMMPIVVWTTYATMKNTSVCWRLVQNNGLLKALRYEAKP